MPAAKFDIKARTANINNRKPIFDFKKVDIPSPSVDFVSRFKHATNATHRAANVWTIDALPDATTILMYIEYHAMIYMKEVDQRNHPKVSISTFIAYCVSLFYGFILLNDMHVRPSPSVYAEDYANQNYKHRFSEFLLSLPVPSFLATALRHFNCTVPETTPNLVTVLSAAGFHHNHHFEMYPPINFYTNIHDHTASFSSRTPKDTVLLQLFQFPLYTLTRANDDAANPTAFTYTMANYLGACYRKTSTANTDTYDFYASRRRQMFDTVFNPVLARDYQRRQTLAPINLKAPVFANYHYNPYDMMFCSFPANIAELTTVLTSVAATINGAIDISGTLSSFFEDVSGTSILSHGYSIPRPPVHHNVDTTTIIDTDTNDTIRTRKRYDSDYATDFSWLISPSNTAADNTEEHTLTATAVCDTDNAHPVTVTQASTTFNLLTGNAPADPPTNALTATRWHVFSESEHLYPPVQILALNEVDEESAWKVTAFGMVIRSFELDGSGISIPDIYVSNGLESICFADSALLINYAIRSTTINLTVGHYAQQRVHVKDNKFKSALMLLDFSKVRLPRPMTRTRDTIQNMQLPGLTLMNNVTWIAKSLSFLGLTSMTERYQTHTDRHVPGVTQHALHAWSCYTHTPVSRDLTFTGPGYFGTLDQAPVTYFIMNPRTMYGTNARILNAADPFESMPI